MSSRLAHRTRVLAVGVLAVAALGLTACTGGSGDSDHTVDTVDDALAGSIDEAVQSAMEQSHSTEAVIGVWGSDDSEYLRAYGNDKLDGSTRIRAAQATQPAMCALVLDLVDQGKISLDRKITKDLSRQVGVDDVTYAQLCNMKSGIADFKGAYTDIFANNPTRPWADEELIAQGLVDSPLSWPGKDVHVSDTNAVLLGRVLTVSTGDDLGELLDSHVFSKADMDSSYYPDSEATTVSGTTLTGLTYPSSGGKPSCDVDPVKVTDVSPSMLAGAGATVTTVTDLKNFYDHYLDGTFGGEEAKVVTDTFPLENPERDDKGEPKKEVEGGTQWSFGVEKVGSLYGRSGSITGTLTAAYHDPDSGYSVVVSLNNSSAGADFAKNLALKLAAVSKDAGSGPEIDWSIDDQNAKLKDGAICQ